VQPVCAILLAAAAAAATTPPRTPTPVPAPTLSLTAAQRGQAQKDLAAAVTARQGAKWKPGGSKGGKSTGFQAHRCAVIYDERVAGKQREANGPFRTTCSDWVVRSSRDLAQKDADQPCTANQFGANLAGCTTWIEQWDAVRAKWSEISRKSSP
jgi:hypothetical protein